MSCFPWSSVAGEFSLLEWVCLGFLGRLCWLYWVSFCLSECVYGFLVAFVGCTWSPSCLRECVSGLWVSVLVYRQFSFSLVLVSSFWSGFE